MNYAALVKAIRTANSQLQGRAVMAVNQALLLRNWLVGEWILEFEHNGKDRAKYGGRLLEKLAADLKQAGLKGLDARTLRDCRGFVRYYPQIRGTVSPEFLAQPDSGDSVPRIPSAASPEFTGATSTGIMAHHATLGQAPPADSPTPLSPNALLRLSWSHLQELISIDDPWKRAFFENECLKANWSVRQLRRQIGTLLFERTGLSTNKKSVIERARKQEPQETFADLIRDPYVLEFTGLAERPEYVESDLESALLSHLQSFLLELGVGFCFEARQRRITVGRQHDYIDLVFYHRRLRCHVLVDLKVRPFTHGDAGQMNFYLNWWMADEVIAQPRGRMRAVFSLGPSDRISLTEKLKDAFPFGIPSQAIEFFAQRVDGCKTMAEAILRVLSADKDIDSTPMDVFARLRDWERTGLLEDLNLTVKRCHRPVATDGEPDDIIVTYDQLSDGEQMLLGRMGLLFLLRGQDGSLLLLDEPETHFNDVWKREIVEMVDMGLLNNTAANVIISTHTSIVLTDAFAAEVTVLDKSEGSTTARGVTGGLFGTDPGEVNMNVFRADSSIGSRSVEILDQLLKTEWKGRETELEAVLNVLGSSFHRAELRAILRKLRAETNGAASP